MDSIRDTLRKITGLLTKRPQPHRDAQEILCCLLGISRTELLITLDETIPAEVEKKAFTIASKVAKGKPLEYELGYCTFMGLKLKVNPFVLIPRPDTEILVEEATKKTNNGCSVLDLCTGSGCIALSMKKRNPFCTVMASDLSLHALRIAKENATNLNIDVEFVRSDLFESIDKTFDIIVSNPPYIPRSRIPMLQKEISFEPIEALDGGEDGLDFYRRINDGFESHLAKDGTAYFEIDCPNDDERQNLLDIFVNRDINIVNDLSGRPRVLKVRFK
jgi:release factor glutamine methyltransferase